MKAIYVCLMVIWGTFIDISAQSLSVEDSLKFCQEEISDAVFCRMMGKSYKEECTTPREELRYLRVLHYNKVGEELQGELVCHKDIADDLLAIFRELYQAKYPIERMVLIDEYDADDEASMRANNTSAFNFRKASGMRTLSKHSTGMAIDINPLYNPLVKHREGRTRVYPSNATPYIDRSQDFPYKIVKGDLCYRLFKKYGFSWGGDWKSSKDYQHFEKR
jgi:hypothetical protein